MMLMSVSRGDSLELDLQDFDRGVRILKATELKMHRTFGGLGQAKYSDATEKILNYIKGVGITTRSLLMAKFYRDVDGGTLKIIEETMTHMKVVRIELLEKGDKKYEWIGPRD